MPQTQDHIVKSFDDSLEQLRQNVVRMGGLAEAQLARAIQALSRRDAALAAEVVKGDAEIDRLEQEIGAQAIRVLALGRADLREGDPPEMDESRRGLSECEGMLLGGMTIARVGAITCLGVIFAERLWPLLVGP